MAKSTKKDKVLTEDIQTPEVTEDRLAEIRAKLEAKDKDGREARLEKKMKAEIKKEAGREEREKAKAEADEKRAELVVKYEALQEEINQLKQKQKDLGIKRTGGGGGASGPRPTSTSGNYKTIRSLMNELFEDPEVTYEATADRVIEEFPTSAYAKTHYSWYKRAILNPDA